jgi:hypothetical protein
MTADEVRVTLESLIPGCRRTNPILYDRLPGEIYAAETLVGAVPLYPRGYVALTDQRLLSLDHPLRLASGHNVSS